MSTQKSYSIMLLSELKAEAEKLGIDLPYNATRREIIDKLKFAAPQAPKKRGRPSRKEQSEESADAEAAPKKRGRPRKTEQAEAPGSAEAAPRRRGRSRKTEQSAEPAPAEIPSPVTAEPETAPVQEAPVPEIPVPEVSAQEPAPETAAAQEPVPEPPPAPAVGSPYGAMRARRFAMNQSGNAAAAQASVPSPASPDQPEGTPAEGGGFVRRPVYERRVSRIGSQTVPQMLDSDECGTARGTLEIQPDGYGFLRAIDPGQKDVYISAAQIRRFSLRNGDLIAGRTRPERENERYLAILFISTINGVSPEEAMNRPQFENLTPIYPNRRLRLENPEGRTDFAIRLLDLVAPVGYGQRGLIVSPPKAGKTTLLKAIAQSIARNAPDAELIVLLIDERPEEVTDMMRSVRGQVYYSTFDQDGANHIAVAESTLEKARRSVENKKDVIILMDSITRLARASNLTCTPSGRLLSGGLDPAALAMPKRFFGSARCLEEGGSLTILATALVDTGSRLDDIIYEEFKGTGNMELHLDRKLQERRVFPAIDLYKSGTRHEENLLTADEQNAIWKVRKLLSGNQDEATELLIDMMSKTQTNAEFTSKLEGWLQIMDSSRRK